MKIQDALTQNLDYWKEQEKSLIARLVTYQKETENIARQVNEAQQQIMLYTKASDILPTLDQVQVDNIDVVK